MIADAVVHDMTPEERAQIVRLALGRVFQLGSRPTQPGDVEQYESCRALVMAASEPRTDYVHNYVRDRLKGAQGDGR